MNNIYIEFSTFFFQSIEQNSKEKEKIHHKDIQPAGKMMMKLVSENSKPKRKEKKIY